MGYDTIGESVTMQRWEAALSEIACDDLLLAAQEIPSVFLRAAWG